MSTKHTPEPWRWELNLKSKGIELCGGKPSFDLTVMDFTRWGMGRATPRVRDAEGLLDAAHKYGEPVAGREHHADWFQGINHPDMNRMVDCVNACAGIENPADAIQAARDALQAVRADRHSVHTDHVWQKIEKALQLLRIP